MPLTAKGDAQIGGRQVGAIIGRQCAPKSARGRSHAAQGPVPHRPQRCRRPGGGRHRCCPRIRHLLHRIQPALDRLPDWCAGRRHPGGGGTRLPFRMAADAPHRAARRLQEQAGTRDPVAQACRAEERCRPAAPAADGRIAVDHDRPDRQQGHLPLSQPRPTGSACGRSKSRAITCARSSAPR